MINFNNLFIETYTEFKNKNTQVKYATNTKYTAENICNAVTDFVKNSCYFSLFKNAIEGTYLNQIHQFLVNCSFYDNLYSKLLTIYLNITNYETLDILSGDSTFIRNIIGVELNGRNPHYYNKPGFKLNLLVDKLRTAI